MAQIKSKHPNFQNCTLNAPIDGEITVVDGIAEVSDELAPLLLANETDWEALEELEEELEEETEETEEEKTDGLDELTLEEMIDLAKQGAIKGYTLFIKDERKMRSFLRKKMKPKV